MTSGNIKRANPAYWLGSRQIIVQDNIVSGEWGFLNQKEEQNHIFMLFDRHLTSKCVHISYLYITYFMQTALID